MSERKKQIVESLAARLDPGRLERLVREAEDEAYEEARRLLKELLVQVLLEQALRRAGGSGPSQPAAPPGPVQAAFPGASGDGQPAGAVGEEGAEVGYYAYGIVADEAAGPLPALDGVGGSGRVYAVGQGPLRLVLSTVPLGAFTGPALEQNMSDPAWLEACVRRHEHVQEAIMGSRTLLPVRFGTLFRSEEAACSFLERHEGELRDVLGRLRGKQEWGLKLFVRRSLLAEAVAREQEGAPQGEGTAEGAAYFARKRRERIVEEAVGRHEAEAAAQVHERLARLAAEAVALPPPRRAQAGEADPVALHAAYLVEASAQPRFETELERLQGALGSSGFTLALTGPWPPYHFVDLRIDT